MPLGLSRSDFGPSKEAILVNTEHPHAMSEPAGPAPNGQILDNIEDFAQRLRPGARLIGIDAGTKTFGLALSDVSRTIASPLETIRRTKFAKDMQRLTVLANEHAIAGLVLGSPTIWTERRARALKPPVRSPATSPRFSSCPSCSGTSACRRPRPSAC